MENAPQRTAQHDALGMFLGRWRAEGLSYGGTDQSGADPKANGERWESEHEAHWHSGSFFLVQDERAQIGEERLDTLWILGVDAATGEHFARTFENHGFYRNYRLVRDGDLWSLSGDTERATILFSDRGRKQVLRWEWKPANEWLPLCDRTAIRMD